MWNWTCSGAVCARSAPERVAPEAPEPASPHIVIDAGPGIAIAIAICIEAGTDLIVQDTRVCRVSQSSRSGGYSGVLGSGRCWSGTSSTRTAQMRISPVR